MKKTFKKLLAFLMIVSMVALSACNNTGTTSGSSAATSAAGSSQAASGELMGKPWIDSELLGNLPAAAPEVKDDVYLHYNYDFLSKHQDDSFSYFSSRNYELKDAVTKVINDKSKTGHDMEQLRIFYDQAKDLETLKKTGLSEVQPYLDMIDSVTSIEKMNELLSSDKFPFTPFVQAFLAITDTRGKMVASLYPNFLLFDALIGSTFYQDPEDEDSKIQYDNILKTHAYYALLEYDLLGIDEQHLEETRNKVISFEKTYGKHAENLKMYLKAEYGYMAKLNKENEYTLDQICALCPKLPMKAMLSKLKKDKAEIYSVTHGWLEALNDLWTEDNLEIIKLIAKAKILNETKLYRDPSENLNYAEGVTPEDFAFAACQDLNTFDDVIAKTYADEVIGPDGIKRITKLASELVDVYKELIDKTVWMDGMSAALAKEKLENMTLNIIEPVEGYRTLEGVNLKTTAEGGTLFSNYLLLKESRLDWEAKRIGKKAGTDLMWRIFKPSTENAFYDASTNSINVYPGVTTSVIYDKNMTDSDLLATVGTVVGHEISHAFDYTGSQIDGYGRCEPIFSNETLDGFLKKCEAISSYFGTMEYLPGKFVNGSLVRGEATADLSGMQAVAKLAEKIPDFDYDRFLSNYSLLWAETMTNESLQLYSSDEHPYSYLRVNICSQMQDFLYDKLGVKEGDGMYLPPDKRIVLWDDKK